ncbi:radical SAM/SPASM domain-containing protein [Marinilabilia salmonicolor]|uniref:Radical SAM protein with 4Fe4S-binding SPASM domain n=1 Tax=Marinilabilia salmonicolor TaxID=989 RepID=A0A368UQG3_9BACT|nr:radical SAM protein [Marinilabilia salmonicolor]RCW29644.1 radical SAM protein with 4Fe4S-binding SPASM domain [Marinilabilia salmonicolor]
MYFMQKSNVLFRNYESFGYITDNRNFEYRQTNNNQDYIGDKILSESGAVFMSVLEKKPLTIKVLASKINRQFTDIDLKTIKSDAKEFYLLLEKEGFVVSGETEQDCNDKDIKFSYRISSHDSEKKEFLQPIKHPEKTTQDFLEEHFKGKPQLTNLHLEIISKCNERCIHCYIPHDNKISYMKPDLFHDILNQCVKMNVLNLTLSGGEPLLHKNFCDYLRKCREYDFSVNVLSNLTLLNDEIIKEMKLNPLLSVQVSLYSMNSDIHDRITQMKGSFEKTKNAILTLVQNEIPMQLSCPIMKQNKLSYGEVIKWAEKHNIPVGDDYGIIAEYNHTNENLKCRLSIEEIKKVVEDKVANDAKYLEQILSEAEKKKDNKANDSVCSVCRSTICISHNGDVYPCEGWQDYTVGNIKETSLHEIWENSERNQFLRSLRNQDFPQCIKCPDKEYCNMCMVRNANENPTGDPLVVK